LTIKSFTDLIAWQEAHKLVIEAYKLSNQLPKEEKFGLISQMRRSAVSVAANIAEGFKRRGVKNKVLFYNISQSSLEETRYYMILCRDLGYLKDVEPVLKNCDAVAQLMNALIRATEK